MGSMFAAESFTGEDWSRWRANGGGMVNAFPGVRSEYVHNDESCLLDMAIGDFTRRIECLEFCTSGCHEQLLIEKCKEFKDSRVGGSVHVDNS